MAVEALRGYLRELRVAQDISQRELAEVMRLSTRAVADWELGNTDDLKSMPLARAVQRLHGSMEDVGALLFDERATAEAGRVLAQQRLERNSYTAARTADGMPVTLLSRLGLPFAELIEQLPILDLAVRPGERTYVGIRYNIQGSSPIVMVNGEEFTQLYTREIGSSPGDFEWGYAGKGPTLLMNALITYEFGTRVFEQGRYPTDDSARTQLRHLLYQVISTLPRGNNGVIWSIENKELRQFARLTQLIAPPGQPLPRPRP
jgi:transcriptional regulator with XRE-family HTH domain